MNQTASSSELNMNELVNCLMKQLEEKDRQMAELNQTIANLTETINEMKRKLFGISSEKTSKQFNIDGQLSLFDTDGNSQEASEPEMIQIASHTKKKPRATHDEIAKNVPATVVNLTLEGEDLNCPYCNTPMVEIGTKTVRE